MGTKTVNILANLSHLATKIRIGRSPSDGETVIDFLLIRIWRYQLEFYTNVFLAKQLLV